jgi:hypothetical protein
MTIRTVSGLQRLQRGVERRRCGAARVITAMQGGEALHKHFTRQGAGLRAHQRGRRCRMM